MKQYSKIIIYIYSAYILCAPIFLEATNWIVDNTGGGNFTSIGAAVANVSVVSGDTILITAGQIFTGADNRGITITKNLIFNSTDPSDTMPRIDLLNSNYFCIINAGITVSMHNLDIRNGNGGESSSQGGAIHNGGTLYITNCILTNNHVSLPGGGGGAIFNDNDSQLNAEGCTFEANSTILGGTVLNSPGATSHISCCRFIGNSADFGDAIYSYSGTVNATNNWWGSNSPDASKLFYGINSTITYIPYLVINLLPDPLFVSSNCSTLITADFTQNSSGQDSDCDEFFSGEVLFSTSEGTITPTPVPLINGKATATLSDISGTSTLVLCALADADLTESFFEYCATATPISGMQAYVSPSGNDANTGTIISPVKTIARGIELATSCDTTGTVYLQADSIFTGTGNKNIIITAAVHITKYDNGDNPVIDMESIGRFCTITSTATVSMNNLLIRNGQEDHGAGIYNEGGLLTLTSCTFNDNTAIGAQSVYGGALFNNNDGTLNISNCTFNRNSASVGGAICSTAGIIQLVNDTFTANTSLGGGAIADINGSTILHAVGCTFSKNDASPQMGGALLNSSSTANISCCRFIENTATNGDAIYNSSGTVEAFNNWWGTNNPDPSTLFGGTSVGYEPYLEINLLPDPLLVRIACPSEIVADFTQNSSSQISPCTDFFSGTVTFSSTEGTITPTISLLIDGKATGILSDITSFEPLSLCVFTDSDVATTPYEYCATASPIPGNAYVSSSGDDTNPGTIDYPVRTIERGLEIVSSCVVTGTVYLEAGSIFTGTGNKDLTITSSIIITRYKTGFNPIIDMEHIGRFCIINSDITVSLSDLVIRNGFIVGQGGVIHNNGILNADSCTFTDNRATNGGAIEQDDGISEIHCCRFANNIATSGHGNAIYNASGIVNADNNWWGSNTDPATIANLLYGTITSSPWIQMAIDAEPSIVNVGEPTTLTVTFSSDCIPDGTPVTFNNIYGLVAPTSCLSIHSTCSALASTDFSQAQVCATTDNQTVCTIFNTSGYARFNFGCMCADSDNQHLLIGSYNDIEGAHNLLMGYIFDSSTNTTTAITPVDLGSHIIENIVVYNADSIVYIALLTKQNENCFLRLATCADSGLGFSFTLGDPISMSNQTMKIQWIVGTDGTSYIATDMQDTLSIFKADLATLTLTSHDTITNLAGATNSTFLYWAVQANGLYLVQGYDAANVATYKVNPGTGEFIGAGVTTDVSSLFSVSLACSTCYNYLALGGTNTSHQAIVASYNINTDGTLEYIRSTTLPASQTNYCERCCCNNSHLLVATDNGIYSINPETFDIIASNVTMINNTWINACWCCDSSLTYCSAINSNHRSYIFQEQGTNLTELLEI